MSDFEFNFHMPEQQKKLLLDIVKLARKNNVLSIRYSASLDNQFIYHVSVYFNDADRIYLNLSENPAFAYDVLGLIKYDSEKHIFVLTPKAFNWADYENKRWVPKFLAKLPSKVKDFMIFIAFILSLALTVLQILESLKSTP
jgi:hypothetical protein